MNYTIIGHTADSSYHDRCGDYISKPGEFETFFFRDDDRDGFIKSWAKASLEGKYDDLLILLNGIPDNRMTDEEYSEYDDLEREMEAQKAILKIEADAAEALRKEAAANAAVEKARLIAHMERQRDLQQLEALKKKLGQS